MVRGSGARTERSPVGDKSFNKPFVVGNGEGCKAIKMEQQACKFLVRETVQNIVHELCINPIMLKANNKQDDERIPCIGSISCGKAE